LEGRAVGIFEGKPRQETMVAVKALKEGSSKEIKAEFFQEVALMSIFDHPNIISLIAVSTEEEPYGMIFEYMTGGDLNHYLRHAQPAETSLDRTQEAKGKRLLQARFYLAFKLYVEFKAGHPGRQEVLRSIPYHFTY